LSVFRNSRYVTVRYAYPTGINTVKPHPLMCLSGSGSQLLSDQIPPGDWRISCRRGKVTTRSLSGYSTITRRVQESGARERDDSLWIVHGWSKYPLSKPCSLCMDHRCVGGNRFLITNRSKYARQSDCLSVSRKCFSATALLCCSSRAA
jgi:hypothetical protein